VCLPCNRRDPLHYILRVVQEQLWIDHGRLGRFECLSHWAHEHYNTLSAIIQYSRFH
jgi:hypothetical protein